MGRRGKKTGHGAKGKGHGGALKEKRVADHPGSTATAKGKGGMTSPVPGLSNLGNTCFFNAVMQCIGQSHYFKSRLDAHVQSPTFTCELRLPTESGGEESGRKVVVQEKVGELTTKLSTFLCQVKEGGGRTLNPKPVFSEICKKASRFSGYHQQDSQELLRYLLDSLRSEEIYRIKKALLLTYNVESGKAKVTESDRRAIRRYGIQAQLARTFVDDVFAGRLVSSVVCQDCSNRSTIHEMFLDLSLPVTEDKSTQDHQQNKGLKKNKGGGKMAAGRHDSNGVATEFSEENESNARFQPKEKELSKHQQKRVKKQQEKAARKEAKLKAKQQQLNRFMSGQSDADSPPQDEKASELKMAKNDGERDAQSLEEENVEVSTSAVNEATDNADISSSPNDDQRIDPPTGEAQDVAMETVQQPSNEVSTRDATFIDYASTGPKPDTTAGPKPDTTAGPKPDTTAGTGPDTTAGPKPDTTAGPRPDTTAGPRPDTTDANDGISELMGGAKLEDDRQGDVGQEGESHNLPTEPDSAHGNTPERILTDLEESLRKFCTPELLTGSNRFACDVCSREQADRAVAVEEGGKVEEGGEVDEGGEVENSQQQGGDGEEAVERREGDGVSETQSDTDNTQEADDHCSAAGGVTCEDSPSLSTRVEEDGHKQPSSVEPESDREEGEVRGQEVAADSPCAEGEEEEELPLLGAESDGEEDSDKEQSKPSSKSRLVFCEATKQFLIENLPLVLTLNLKRFIQHGRRLQKNNRHVSFPILLNMAPFCTDSCKLGHCDTKGQLLYSLYGVVEHSGGMQGGHYTAYVRTRTPITYDPTHGVVPDNQREQRPMELEAAAGSVVGSGEFDLSSTGGQWYFISDSRVRTASESEVLKSQAYLLFYEQLPLSSN